MSSISEIGHAKNVANFQDLINFCVSYGTGYNPVREDLYVNSLLSLHDLAAKDIDRVSTHNAQYNAAVNERRMAFDFLQPLSTRIINAMVALGIDDGKIKNARFFNRKIQGKRASVFRMADPSSPAPSSISASQLSYDQQVQHLSGLIAVLETEPGYVPNEPDLTLSSLRSLKENLNALNIAVDQAFTAICNVRLSRNMRLYGANGLVKRASDVKKYVKSVFGGNSPQYAQVNGILIQKPSKLKGF